MPTESAHAVTLSCHPQTPTDAVRGITARVRRRHGVELAVSYVLDGDLDRLHVPPPRPPRVGSRLREHTCCEMFVARKGAPAYHEFNFSPSGEWATYAFDGYRAPRAAEAGALPAPRIDVRDAAGRLELDAVITLKGLPQ